MVYSWAFFLLSFLSSNPCLTGSEEGAGGGWEQISEADSGDPFDRFGQVLVRVPDQNSDGFDELLVGAPQASPNGISAAGTVFFIDGQTGTEIRRWEGIFATGGFGSAIDVADIDGNGQYEAIIGAPNELDGLLVNPSGRIYLLNLSTYSIGLLAIGNLTTYHLGTSVALGTVSKGDLNSDGIGDILVGQPGQSTGGSNSLVWIYDGAAALQNNMIPLATVEPGPTTERFGSAVDFVSGSGNSTRIVVGSPQFVNGTPYPTGRIDLVQVDPANSNHIWLRNWFGPDYGEASNFGATVQAYEGISRATSFDLVVSAPMLPDSQRPGYVLVYDADSGLGVPKYEFIGEDSGDRFGFSFGFAGEVTGGDRNDLIIGAIEASDSSPANANGKVYIYDGETGSLYWSTTGDPNTYMGFGVVGNLSGPTACRPNIGLASLNKTVGQSNRLTIREWIPYMQMSGDSISASTGGSVSIHVDFPKSDAGQSYQLLLSYLGEGPTIGPNSVVLPLTPAPGSWIYENSILGVYPSYFANASGQLDADGDETILINIPPGVINYPPGSTLVGTVALIGADGLKKASAAGEVMYVP